MEHDIPEIITAFTKEFIEDKQVQWKAFHKRLTQMHIPSNFGMIVTGIQVFLEPMVNGEKVTSKWSAPSTWI